MASSWTTTLLTGKRDSIPRTTSLQRKCSIGVAEFMTGDKTVEDTLKRADSYLYHAKQSGRNRVMND